MRLVPAMRLTGFLSVPIWLTACSGGSDAPQVTGTLPPTQLSTVAVIPPPGSSSNLVAGQTLQLTASPRDASGNIVNATVTWSSSANSVATVSSTGLVTAVGPGSATIIATATTSTSTASSSLVVTVSAPPPVLTSVVVSGSSTVIVGQTTQLTAAPRDQNGQAIAASVTWSTSAAGVATVSATGLVTGVSTGSATITATALAGSLSVNATSVITVSAVPPALTSVAISGGSAVNVGATLQLTASPRDQFGNPITASVGWSTSNAARATVSGSGLVTGVAAGTANITATATLGSAIVSSFVTITVNSPFPASANVVTSGNAFLPASVDISVGGQVSWTGLGGHNVTFASPGSPADINGPTQDSRTFPTVGTFNYSCTIHFGMNGTVIVH